MCGARLFAVRVILQRYKVWRARPPDFGSLPLVHFGAVVADYYLLVLGSYSEPLRTT